MWNSPPARGATGRRVVSGHSTPDAVRHRVQCLPQLPELHVLPTPTESATMRRMVSRRRAISSGTNWYGRGRTTGAERAERCGTVAEQQACGIEHHLARGPATASDRGGTGRRRSFQCSTPSTSPVLVDPADRGHSRRWAGESARAGRGDHPFAFTVAYDGSGSSAASFAEDVGVLATARNAVAPDDDHPVSELSVPLLLVLDLPLRLVVPLPRTHAPIAVENR